MVYTCFLCKWRSDKEPRRSYHKFPSKEELKQKWLDILGKSNVCIGRRTTLCCLHFEEHCFRYGLVNGRKILKDGSFPTLYLTKGGSVNQTDESVDRIKLHRPLMENKSHTSRTTDNTQINYVTIEVPMEIYSSEGSSKKKRECHALWILIAVMSSESKIELPKKPSYYNCYVYGCSNSTLNYNKAFFKIPSNLQRRNQWLKLMHREELIGSACLRARVCQDHFAPNLIKHAQVRTLLLSNACPQLLLPIPDKIDKETQTELGEITLCVCDLQINYQVQTLIKTSNYIVKSYTKLTDPLEGQSSSTNESDPKSRASTCKRTKLIPLLKHAEDIIASVYNYLQAEYEQLKSSVGCSCDLSPLANILSRTAAATGVSERAVCAILEENKRAADEQLEAGAAKRAKFAHDYGDRNVSPISDEESSCEAPDEEQDHVTEQDDYNEQTHDYSQDQDEFEVETLKVEIKDEEDDIPVDPLQLHMSETDSAVQHLIFSNNSNEADFSFASDNTNSADGSKPPAVVVYPQTSSGVLRVMSIEPMTSFATVKTEPEDDPPGSDTTSCDVTYERPPS